tara:strand:+ start:417 stop:587 length:171 start_codon:yes stop_codon:yes gene_type:complete
LAVPKHKFYGWTHFAGLYAAEHFAATEFIIGATYIKILYNEPNIHKQLTVIHQDDF